VNALVRAGRRALAAVGGRALASASPQEETSPSGPGGDADRLHRQNGSLRREVDRLRGQTAALKEEIARLRESLSEAHRAGKRQAAPFSKGAPKVDPKRPGRKPGPDYGVKARRAIPDHIDEQYLAPIDPCCPDCGGDDFDKRVVRQYEEDIPEVKLRVRLFLIEVGLCQGCGRRVQGRHPLQTSDAIGAACVHLGPRAKPWLPTSASTSACRSAR
jgi:hypothetical protein